MRITWIGNHTEGVIAFQRAVENNGVDAFVTLDESAYEKRSAGSREYIEICEQKSNPDTAEAAGGQAEQFLLVRKSDNRLVGMAQYRFGVDPKFCIGYSVRPSERRKGYAKMALQNLLQWLKDQGQVSTPIACEPSNEASKKVILSCGGKLTDTCTYKGIDLMVFEIPIE